MYPQRSRATAIASPHPHSWKHTSALNKEDAYIGEKDFSEADCARVERLSPLLQRRIGCLRQRTPQLAQLASKVESKSQSIRLRFSPCSSASVHFRQKRTSFNQCPAVNAGTSSANGDIASVHGLSQKSERTMLNTSVVSLP